ncbi:hypothetical protein SCLCIDRAFT_1222642 [Scleroderma citrinum Foug A]|uniref:YCII-related domain-containing protein n=1 Tax=Scleroderma citrinum Foug A TaxID=1036808 RepID=A0A0C3DC81_9AGAM|nr:hypothetical protein SCLCIDRAFT_1222642 [Scleroderma citrinum Foug A]
MSPPSFELPKFVLWAPDYADDGALARRMAVRPVHLENANRLIQQGILRVAGGVMTAESIVAAPSDKKFVGSYMIYEAEDLEAVRKLVENDVYYKTGVWDKEKLTILPVLMATALPPVPSLSPTTHTCQ